MNSPTFSRTAITGYGSSLSLSSSAGQFLSIPCPQLNLRNLSWTFEAWIYPTNSTSNNNAAIVAQCDHDTAKNCFHFMIHNANLYGSLFFDDSQGATNLTRLQWHHVAFTFDCATLNQTIYLDGFIDNSRYISTCFQGYNQTLTIGMVKVWGSSTCFDGLIDQLLYTGRTKTAKEILRDATLTVHFSFDNGSIYDQGPLGIDGSLAGNTSFISGRLGHALEIEKSNSSYFKVQGLVLLGVSNHPYSFALWIRTNLQQQSAIIHVSSTLNCTNWCLVLLGLTSTNQLMSYSWNGGIVTVAGPVVAISTWTHVAVTYGSINGLQLYVNGTLSNASASFLFSSNEAPMNLFIGNPNWNGTCGSSQTTCGPYSGAVDDFRLYSRELSPTDVNALVPL